MKRAVMIIIALILLCVPFLLTGCAEDVPSITKADVDAWINANQSIKDLQATKASAADVTTAKNQADAAKKRADEAYTKAENVTAPAVSVSSLNFDNLTDAQITALKNKLGITSSSTGTTTNPTAPAGIVSYTIVSPQTYYQLSSGGYPINIKIFNNTGQSRYVRPQITLTTFDNSVVPAGPVITVTAISNSSGQTAVTFPTPAIAGNTILLISTGGGVNGSGEYLINTGGSLDVFIQLSVTTSPAELWKINVSGSDRPIS